MTEGGGFTSDFVGAKIISVLPMRKTTEAWPSLLIETSSGRFIQLWIEKAEVWREV